MCGGHTQKVFQRCQEEEDQAVRTAGAVVEWSAGAGGQEPVIHLIVSSPYRGFTSNIEPFVLRNGFIMMESIFSMYYVYINRLILVLTSSN